MKAKTQHPLSQTAVMPTDTLHRVLQMQSHAVSHSLMCQESANMH